MISTTICVLKGDGAAPEAVIPTVELLESIAPSLRFETLEIDRFTNKFDRGSVPAPLREQIDAADAVLFGVASDTHIPVLRYLRYELSGGLPANVRPVRSLEGADAQVEQSDPIDYMIVRQNLGGLYAGLEGDLAALESLTNGDESFGPSRFDPETADDGRYAIRPVTADRVRWLSSPANWRHDGPMEPTIRHCRS